MRYTFTKVRKTDDGTPLAVFQMWRVTGFGPWKEKTEHGTASFTEWALKNLCTELLNGGDKGLSAGVYREERADIDEFVNGCNAIQAYRRRNSG